MHEDTLVDPRILAVLKPPGTGDDVTLLRGPGAFSEAASGATFPDRDGIPSLLAGIEDDDAAQVTGRAVAPIRSRPACCRRSATTS